MAGAWPRAVLMPSQPLLAPAHLGSSTGALSLEEEGKRCFRGMKLGGLGRRLAGSGSSRVGCYEHVVGGGGAGRVSTLMDIQLLKATVLRDPVVGNPRCGEASRSGDESLPPAPSAPCLLQHRVETGLM